MTNNSNPKPLHFKTSTGIKNIVGQDLITDKSVAIFELVKNSYDANATEVFVSFNPKTSSEAIASMKEGHILIVDNGTGMSKKDLVNKWLFLAYSEKKENRNSVENKARERIHVGSKGVGRFSCDTLGSKLVIKTKTKDSHYENQLAIDWGKFEGSLLKRFEDIPVILTENQEPTIKGQESYTILEISGLRHSWGNEEITNSTTKLEKLKNPFLEEDNFTIYCGVEIFNYNYKNTSTDNTIKSKITDILKEKSITINANISPEKIVISLTDRGESIYEVEKKNDTILQAINNIKISINYLTPSSKATFTRRMGITPGQYGNVFIYRNNFYVSPYGQEGYDTFGLDKRKTQGYSRYLGNREILGFISISDNQELFRETSSRNNGFIENGYFKVLEEVYMSLIHRPLEKYVQLVLWGEDKSTQNKISFNSNIVDDSAKENFKKSISKGFTINSFSSDLDFEQNNPKNIVEDIIESLPKEKKEKAKKLKKQVVELVNESATQQHQIKKKDTAITNLERQNKNLSNKRSEESYAEQIAHHFTLLSSRLNRAVKNLSLLKEQLPEEYQDKYLSSLKSVQTTKQELDIFRTILLHTNYDTRSASSINWFKLTKWYFTENGREVYYNRFKSYCSIDDNKHIKSWDINSKYIDALMFLENFYKNAFEHNASYIDFSFTDKELTIFSDSTPIAEENLSNIFELGFSTKDKGTGIGLNQIKTYLNHLGFNIKIVSNIDGVRFIIKRAV